MQGNDSYLDDIILKALKVRNELLEDDKKPASFSSPRNSGSLVRYRYELQL
jgi:hypothetical protein